MPYKFGSFFITFTCHKWWSLINIVDAYDIAFNWFDILELQRETDLLTQLSKGLEAKRKANNKLHEIGELSFNWKECNSHCFFNQKLDYMHDNLSKLK